MSNGIKKKILIVEDDNFVAEVYSTKLSEIGYEVRVAQNGKEGLELIGKENPDLMLLDIMMPVMDGVEVLKELKKAGKLGRFPIILLTNIGEKNKIEEVRNFGVDDYLIKSQFTPAEVLEKVQKVLSKKQKNGQSDTN